MVELEKRGVPTVAIIAEGFARDARRTAETFGLAGLPIARVAQPFTNESAERISALVEHAIGQIVDGLVEQPKETAGPEIPMVPDEWISFESADLLDALADMNRQYLEWQWGDGFPLVPPTRDAVRRLLAGTSASPDTIIGTMEPGFGIATVEKIAINAVMAGCRPEHLPIVIAAVECLVDPKMGLRSKAMSTGPAAPLVIVNGPARARAGLNSGICALGPGAPSFANTVIGRAVRLCMMNIGHTYPGVSDMDVIGTPNKYSMCVAENEEDSPWEAYHVARGFARDESVVTVQFLYGLCDLHDFESTDPDGLIHGYASAAKYLDVNSTGHWLTGRRADTRQGTEEQEQHFLLISPAHAKIFGRFGLSRSDVATALHREARLSFRDLSNTKSKPAIRAGHPELDWLWASSDALLPVLEDADCYNLFVLGAGPGRSSFGWGMGGPVSKKVTYTVTD